MKRLFSWFVEFQVERIEVLGIQLIRRDPKPFAEPLVMHNFPLPQELNGVAHVGVVCKAQNIVVRSACLLLCCNRIKTTCALKIPMDFNRDYSCSRRPPANQDIIDHRGDNLPVQAI